LLLDLGYALGLLLLSPWILYRLAISGGWREAGKRAGVALGEPLAGSIWLHGSSAGEISLLAPLVERLERERPATPIVISTVTATGLAAARRLYPRHRVVPAPLDLSVVVRRALARYRPALVVLVESEFWPNFILGARRAGVPVAVVNAKMSAKSQRRYSRTRLVPRVLRELAVVAAQNEEHAARFRALGVPAERIAITGNMKYDLAKRAATPERATELRELFGYAPGDFVVIGGSLHAGEDEALLAAFEAVRAARERAALVIVPRYPADAQSVVEHAAARGFAAVRKTEVDAGRETAPGPDGVLVVDTIGELGALYSIADAAFVGGSLFYRGSNKGGHNLMEPAVLGVPVLFGPHNFSFKDTVEDLLAADGGRLVRDAEELGRELRALAADDGARRAMGQRARGVVLAGRGATDRNFALLAELLPRTARRLQPLPFERKMPRAVSGPDSH